MTLPPSRAAARSLSGRARDPASRPGADARLRDADSSRGPQGASAAVSQPGRRARHALELGFTLHTPLTVASMRASAMRSPCRSWSSPVVVRPARPTASAALPDSLACRDEARVRSLSSDPRRFRWTQRPHPSYPAAGAAPRRHPWPGWKPGPPSAEARARIPGRAPRPASNGHDPTPRRTSAAGPRRRATPTCTPLPPPARAGPRPSHAGVTLPRGRSTRPRAAIAPLAGPSESVARSPSHLRNRSRSPDVRACPSQVVTKAASLTTYSSRNP
jgi:hypothetical protein